jgi:hypothetical protein
MTESEILVQRFLDQDLSAEERMRLLVRLGREAALRDRLLELEQLAFAASRLPRPAVPDDFVARVMARTAPASPAWHRWLDALWMPRVVEWNLAGATAACLALVVTAGVAGSLVRGRSAAPPVSATPDPLASRATAVPVRLVVLEPGATSVQVAGDFNGWNPALTPLAQVSSGAWSVTLTLDPGRYEYMFVVDGQQWIADPFAAEQNDDGFGSRNAVLEVRAVGGEVSTEAGAPL